METTEKKTFLYGYITIAILLYGFLVSNLFTNNLLQVFLPAIAAKNNVEYSSLLIWNTAGGILGCAATYFAGFAIRRFGCKAVIAVSAALQAFVCFLIPSVPNSLAIILICINAFLFIFYAGNSLNVLIGNWFPRKKGTVMGIVTASSVIGNIILFPWFSDLSQNQGIAYAMHLFSIFPLIYAFLAAFVIKDFPAEVGLDPDNQPLTEAEKIQMETRPSEKSPWTTMAILKCPRFLLTMLAWGLILLGQVGFGTVAVQVLLGKGMEQAFAVRIIAIAGIIATIGSIISGIADDKLGTVTASAIWIGIQAAGYLLLALSGQGAIALLVAGVMCVYWVAGSVNNLMPSHIMGLSGPKHFNAVYMVVFAGISILRACGSAVAGISLRISGGYSNALFIFTGFAVLGILIIIAVGKNYQEPPAGSEN